MGRGIQIVFDAHDPRRLAEFWADALGYVIQPPPAEFESWEAWAASMGIPEENWNDASAIVDPDGQGPRVFIQRVPEGKSAKNRVHLDIDVAGGSESSLDEQRSRIGAEVERLTAIGASIIGPMEEREEYWVVMQDPEGNEFCVV